MILVTGNKKGFTFFELMVSLAILSLGIVLVYQSFISTLNAYSYYLTYLGAQHWIDEKAWEIEDSLIREKKTIPYLENGKFIIKNKTIFYQVNINELSPSSLYKINISAQWEEKNRKANISSLYYVSE